MDKKTNGSKNKENLNQEFLIKCCLSLGGLNETFVKYQINLYIAEIAYQFAISTYESSYFKI